MAQALSEVLGRDLVATQRFHHSGDEVIDNSRGLRRLLDEQLLHLTPFVRETQPGGFRQWFDVGLSIGAVTLTGPG